VIASSFVLFSLGPPPNLRVPSAVRCGKCTLLLFSGPLFIARIEQEAHRCIFACKYTVPRAAPCSFYVAPSTFPLEADQFRRLFYITRLYSKAPTSKPSVCDAGCAPPVYRYHKELCLPSGLSRYSAIGSWELALFGLVLPCRTCDLFLHRRLKLVETPRMRKKPPSPPRDPLDGITFLRVLVSLQEIAMTRASLLFSMCDEDVLPFRFLCP